MAVINAVGNALTGSTGSGAFVGATAPTLTQVAFSTTSGIIGTTTNDSAAAGSVGQIISSTIAASPGVSITTATSADITSLSLTAGDWDVWGNIGVLSAGTLTTTAGWGSNTSATLPDASLYNIITPGAATQTLGFDIPYRRVSLSGTTTVYLSVFASFTSTAVAYGGIFARRVR